MVGIKLLVLLEVLLIISQVVICVQVMNLLTDQIITLYRKFATCGNKHIAPQSIK